MIEATFDDDWFVRTRGRLLSPLARDLRSGRPLLAPIPRASESVRRGSAAHHDPGDHRRGHKEQTLSRLAPKHAGAIRAHLAFYRACLESTALVASDDLIHSAVEIEWLWYSSGFKPFYRDHLAHVMKVAATALHLLRDREGPLSRPGGGGGGASGGTGGASGALSRKPAASWVAERLAARELGCEALRCAARRLGNSEESLQQPDFWRYAMLEAVKLAGLLHDMAYPFIMARKVLRAAEPANAFYPFEIQPAHSVARALDAVSRTLVAVPFNRGRLPDPDLSPEDRRVCTAVLGESHALQAAVSILGLRAQADRFWRLDPFEAFVVEWAALAAALHDFDKQFELARRRKPRDQDEALIAGWLEDGANLEAIRPSFTRDPVSYLLAFADQIQDFGRLHYDWQQQPGGSAGENELRAKLVYPWRSVTLRTEDPAGGGPPGAILVYLPDKAEGSSHLWEHKAADLEKVFGTSGWMDSAGLFGKLSFELREKVPAA